MNKLTKNIIFNMHPLSLLLSAGAVLAGLAASVGRGGVAVFPALNTMLVAIIFQISGNLYYGSRRAEKWRDAQPEDDDPFTPMGYKIIRTLSNISALFAITLAFPLFTRMGWLAIVYLGVLLGLVYFYFGGRRPLVRTRWSVLITFLLFGPVAVSGTAMVQNHYMRVDLTPILLYSLISGLLAVTAHLSIQFLRIKEDVRDNMNSLLSVCGSRTVGILYLLCVVAVCGIMVAFPDLIGFGYKATAFVLSALLLITSGYVYHLMGFDTLEASIRLRKIVMVQYLAVMIVMLVIVLYTMDFQVTFLD